MGLATAMKREKPGQTDCGAGLRQLLTCVDAAVPLQLARLGEGLVTGVALEHPGLLGAQRRACLVGLHVLLQGATE